MPQALLIQNSFNSGEISPLAIGRSDTAPYKNALAKCRNMIPTPVGPVVKRPCTRYVTEIVDSSKESRLIGFSFSNIASYIIEFADQQIRLFTPTGVGGWLLPPTHSFNADRIDLSAETIGLADAHYYEDGSGPYRLTTDGTLPTGLSEGTDYYIVLPDGDASAASFALSLTSGGAAVNISAKGTGTHGIAPATSIIQGVTSPYLESELFELDFVPSGDILYITHPNHAPRQLERRAANGFRMREVFFQDGPWEELNLKVQNGVDPSNGPAVTQAHHNDFAPADIGLNVGDTLANSITVPNHGYDDRDGPLEIQTTGVLPTGLTANPTTYYIVWINKHQFSLSTTLGGAAVAITARGSGVHTLTGWSGDALVFDGATLNTDSPSTDIKRRARWRTEIDASGSPNWTWGVIESVSDSKNCVTTVYRAQASGIKTSVWRLGAFYPGNYPAFCGIHEQRLWFAGTQSRPNTLWGSQVGDFANFAPDDGVDDFDDAARLVTPASGISFTLGAGQVDKFSFIAAVRQMIVGTTGAIWPIQSSSNLESISSSNINARPTAIIGASVLKPVLVSDEIVYLSASSHRLLAVGFEFERDAFVPQNLSILADHFTEKRIIQLAYAQEPHSVVWGCRDDGLLVGCTYERTQRVLGWHAHHLGGTDVKVKSVATANDDTLDYDQLWMIVERTINGQQKRYIEFSTKPFYTDSKLEDAEFLDSSPVPYDGPPIQQVTGLDHLEGESIFALADGAWIADLEVIGGTINLPSPASKIIVGLNYNSYIKVLPVEAEGAPGGSIIDKTKRLIESWVRLHQTNYVQVGAELDEMVQIPIREIFDVAEDPVPLTTEDVNILTAHGVGVDQSFYIGSDKPVPLDVIGLTGRVEWSQR